MLRWRIRSQHFGSSASKGWRSLGPIGPRRPFCVACRKIGHTADAPLLLCIVECFSGCGASLLRAVLPILQGPGCRATPYLRRPAFQAGTVLIPVFFQPVSSMMRFFDMLGQWPVVLATLVIIAAVNLGILFFYYLPNVAPSPGTLQERTVTSSLENTASTTTLENITPTPTKSTPGKSRN